MPKLKIYRDSSTAKLYFFWFNLLSEIWGALYYASLAMVLVKHQFYL